MDDVVDRTQGRGGILHARDFNLKIGGIVESDESEDGKVDEGEG